MVDEVGVVKGFRNSKFGNWKLEENAHAKPANILLTPSTQRTRRSRKEGTLDYGFFIFY